MCTRIVNNTTLKFLTKTKRKEKIQEFDFDQSFPGVTKNFVCLRKICFSLISFFPPFLSLFKLKFLKEKIFSSLPLYFLIFIPYFPILVYLFSVNPLFTKHRDAQNSLPNFGRLLIHFCCFFFFSFSFCLSFFPQ